MIPLVDGLRRGYPNLIKVDVATYPKLAREFGITAIPSFITVSNGRIQGIRLGAQSEAWLRARLGPDT
jgi:thioredoxin-like negative regulator of GroEL